MSGFELNAKAFQALADRVRAYGDDAEGVVNEVLHEQGGPMIYERINPLIHPSGRTFKGHTRSARKTKWPLYKTDENLAVTVTTRAAQRYLYFPNDGSNTRRHAGGQHFFLRGANAAAPEILDRCMAALTREWEQ